MACAADCCRHGRRWRLQIALERFEAFVESLQISFEFVLAAVGDRQHQGRKVVEDR
jgi:hypothetical protein